MTAGEKKQALQILDQLEKSLTDLYAIMPAVVTPLLQKVRILRGIVL